MPADQPEATTPRHRARRTRPVIDPIQSFLKTETAGGVLLAAATAIALVWANTRWSGAYADLWHHEVSIGIGRFAIEESLGHWVNDLAMAVFFYVVGLEIKRELVDGELQDPRTAILPIACAVGGMVVPALLYLGLNAGHADTVGGWGVPMATDIAFSIGVLTLLGRRVPAPMKVFLLTLAIVDDIGAIVVIALFYSDTFELRWLLAAVCGLVVVVLLQRLGVRSLPLYVLLAACTWVATFESGVHATIAGVALGLVTPARPLARRGGGPDELDDDAPSPLDRFQHALHPWSAFVVLPLFALANAGVSLSGGIDLGSPLTQGVLAGLVVGKPLGIVAAAVLVIRVTGARLPAHADWLDLVGVGCLAGIGFTVSLFVSGLAFEGDLVDHAKVAVLAASVVAGVLGAIALMARPTAHPLVGPPAGEEGAVD